MCKQKRLKCDESKPSCNQCVRRGRLCPGYRREIKWSTMITAKDGKTRPPPDEAIHDEGDQVIPSEDAAASIATQSQWVSISDLSTHSKADGHDQNFEDPANAYTDLILGTEAWAGVSKGPKADIEWTEWTGEADLVASTADDINRFESIDDMCTDLATLDPVFSNSPVISTTYSRYLSLPSPNPVDLPTFLITHWFTNVCSMWCAYDSPQNWYRNLAGDTWQHSEPVFYALQAMSASVLVDSLPHLKQALPKLTGQAAQSIQRAVQTNATLQTEQAGPLPTDLLLAVLGMGTSICWSDPRQLGFWFLDQARRLLNRYSSEGDLALDTPGQQTVEYFRQALIYWEMLANVVTKDYQNILRSRRSRFKKRIRRAMSMSEPDASIDATKATMFGPGVFSKTLEGPTPHPWTGISGEIQQTFGLVMGLCQNRCVTRSSDTNLSADKLCDALCDIELANDLEKELLGFDFIGEQPDTKARPNETGDPNAPLSHLVDTAEAYRLASLLHLYLAFSDLEVKFIRSCTSDLTADNDAISWTEAPTNMHRDQALLTLTLRLVDVLKRIPANSGARCIQPILLISAAAGLKFDVPVQTASPKTSAPPTSIHVGGTMINRGAFAESRTGSSMLFDSNSHTSGFPDSLDALSACDKMPLLTSLTLEVSTARRFIVNRLGALQQSLPPRPIGVALALVRAIWFNYDSADERLRGMHWMNTMVNSGLQTLFG
jgi:hypothetical protein